MFHKILLLIKNSTKITAMNRLPDSGWAANVNKVAFQREVAFYSLFTDRKTFFRGKKQRTDKIGLGLHFPFCMHFQFS